MTAGAGMRVVVLIVIFLFTAPAFSQDAKSLPLPQPQMQGGKPLMQTLKERRSIREFSNQKLSPQVLSNLLWAADGFNRSDRRTAPTAMNRQEIDIYVATADGLFLYDAKAHALNAILSNDIRELTGRQAYVKEAPVNLIYVADTSKMMNMSDPDRKLYSAADTGFISQNVYLFCASEGLATTVRGLIDREALAKAMKLRPEQQIILAQAVGYPKK